MFYNIVPVGVGDRTGDLQEGEDGTGDLGCDGDLSEMGE